MLGRLTGKDDKDVVVSVNVVAVAVSVVGIAAVSVIAVVFVTC